LTLGHEVAGEVEDRGDVKSVKHGDRVCLHYWRHAANALRPRCKQFVRPDR
jgi:D-arabinose 1-dehydrogenase-like Zn-dependent alcohol dehydrogenase